MARRFEFTVVTLIHSKPSFGSVLFQRANFENYRETSLFCRRVIREIAHHKRNRNASHCVASLPVELKSLCHHGDDAGAGDIAQT